jgi:hypothetical protein
MTVNDFNKLDEDSKKVMIFEAKKVVEKQDGFTKFQLFKIDNFFVETKTTLKNFTKRCLTTYTVRELPSMYSGDVLPFITGLR